MILIVHKTEVKRSSQDRHFQQLCGKMRCHVKQDFTSLVNVILAMTGENAFILKQGIEDIEWCYKKEPFVMTLSIDPINYCFTTLHAQYNRIIQYQTLHSYVFWKVIFGFWVVILSFCCYTALMCVSYISDCRVITCLCVETRQKLILLVVMVSFESSDSQSLWSGSNVISTVEMKKMLP